MIAEIPPEEFAELIEELTRKRLQNNHERLSAGFGRSQTLGIQMRWSYIPWLGRTTWMRAHLWQLLQNFAEKHMPDFHYDAVTVNDNYLSAPHKDKNNEGESMTVTFGDFTGGELMIQDGSGNQSVAIDTRHRLTAFNGATTLHWTAPFEGRRFCLVFYRVKWPQKYLPRFNIHCEERPDGLEVHCGYDGSIVVLNAKGKVVREVRKAHPKLYRTRLSTKGQPTLSDWALQRTPGQAEPHPPSAPSSE